eukprot:NODE_2642_length_661_cov_591.952614_g2173_i0.p2 GENE.NODE_2642_length_661_cov_591.952614_g2173_i0~~NODE_2642_length_661_cov_591.952614_g2173_i0.p2  ORF type:complete len:167 (+),score=18.94 NODE_2642_length_661_cov_591.952614_g2173_i0:87-587(+)
MAGLATNIEVGVDDRTFQQQERIFIGRKKGIKKFRNSLGKQRYWKNVGLGFKTPKAAIEGTYVDRKCPFTGNVSIRGRILRGVIKSAKMKRSVVCLRNYLKFVPKYQRYEKRHKNITVHMSPCHEYSIGDEAIFGETRSICKTIRFSVLQVNPKSKKQGVKKFDKF